MKSFIIEKWYRTELRNMARGEGVLEIIVKEFPQLNDQIAELYCESTSFIELCEDYAVCLNSIEKLESVKKTVKEKELIGLKMALLDLKEEILSRF